MALRSATSCERIETKLSKARSHSCNPAGADDLTHGEELAVIEEESGRARYDDKNVGRLRTTYTFEESAQ
jgi:hypothetical protein